MPTVMLAAMAEGSVEKNDFNYLPKSARHAVAERSREAGAYTLEISELIYSRIRPGPGFFFLWCLDFVEVPQRVVTDGHHLVVAGKTWLGGGFGPRAQKNHVLIAGIVELIELARGDRHQHTGCELARRAVGEMKCALSFNAVKLLVGGVLVHGPLGSWIITINPGVKMIRGE